MDEQIKKLEQSFTEWNEAIKHQFKVQNEMLAVILSQLKKMNREEGQNTAECRKCGSVFHTDVDTSASVLCPQCAA